MRKILSTLCCVATFVILLVVLMIDFVERESHHGTELRIDVLIERVNTRFGCSGTCEGRTYSTDEYLGNER